MPLTFVLDEHLGGPLYAAILAHNAASAFPVDAARVGDSPGLPYGTRDPALLAWAERAGRLLVSHDYSSMPGHLADHLADGDRSPGVLLLRPNIHWSDVVEYLATVAHAGRAEDYADVSIFIP